MRWHHFEQFRKSFDKQLVASIKPDGGIIHHGFHYYAYGSGGIASSASLAAALSKADLPLEREALDSIRGAVNAMVWYCGRTTLWSLSGRAASGELTAPTVTLKDLADAYAPYNDGKPDPVLLANYLRLATEKSADPELVAIAPAAAPSGSFTLPTAALLIQRRDNWLAGIKGYSKYWASGESYAKDNRFGLYMSMGQLELLTHPKDFPTVLGSGTHPNEGYDWNAIEGATTIHSPLSGLANGNGTRSPLSKEAFVGGLSNGSNGLFALTFNLPIPKAMTGELAKDAPQPEPLKALKTWFTFDNRIICLGSGISTANLDDPVRTNLFQKFLTEEFSTTTLNGEALTLGSEPVKRDETKAATLIDPYGNAYFTTEGTPVHLRISEQKSRDSQDRRDTTGNYATAWIEHGKNPQDAGYEYAVLVQPTEAEIQAFTAKPPYQVLKKDAQAHIVHDTASNTTGYVIFDQDAELPRRSRVEIRRPAVPRDDRGPPGPPARLSHQSGLPQGRKRATGCQHHPSW